MYEKPLHYEYIRAKIQNPILKTKAPLTEVTIPSVDSLIGDKLTAFAPHTTGIKLKVGKQMEIIKQLFDLYSLIDKHKDLNTINKTFFNISKAELNYRNINNLSHKEILEDSFNTTITIGKRGKINKGEFDELEMGRQRLSSHILGYNYSQRQFFTDASKVAYLSSSLLKNKERIDIKSDEIKDINLIEYSDYLGLNKLKKMSPEALYYFEKALKIYNS